jgi:hypothetical protein
MLDVKERTTGRYGKRNDFPQISRRKQKYTKHNENIRKGIKITNQHNKYKLSQGIQVDVFLVVMQCNGMVG